MPFEEFSQQLDDLFEYGVPTDEESVAELFRLRSRLDAAIADASAGYDTSMDWQLSGAHSCKAYLTGQTHLPEIEVARSLRLGRALRDLPLVAEALRDGEITTAHVLTIVRLRNERTSKCLERDEEELVGYAKSFGWFSEFARVAQYWDQLADPDGSDEKAEEQYNRRNVFLEPSFGGSYLGRMTLDAVSGEIVRNELKRLELELFEQDWKLAKDSLGRDPLVHELARTSSQRRADAMVEMATRSHTAPADGQRPSPLLTVLVDYKTLSGRVCELADGQVVSPWSLLDLLTQAEVERAVFGPGNRVEVGKRSRLFRGATKRAIELRDRCCTHPYCERPASQCQCDHIVEYSEGGLTTQENGRLLCGFHNRQRNQGRMRGASRCGAADGGDDDPGDDLGD